MALNGVLKLYCRILDRVVDGDTKLLGVLVVVLAMVVRAVPPLLTVHQGSEQSEAKREVWGGGKEPTHFW